MANYANSTRYYRKYYNLVSIAVIVMMAVLSGSLLLGDSVRGTLYQRVQERLGNTQTLITSGTSFMDQSILNHPLYADARGYLICEGYVSAGAKMVPVMVWATDGDSITRGNAVINTPLQEVLGKTEDLVLHLPAHSLVPSGTLFVKERYSTQMRLHISGTRTVEEGGNLLLRNEQALPLNVFLNRQELAEVMELQGKINLIMSPQELTDQQISSTWTPAISGIRLDDSRITTDRIFLQKAVVETLQPERTCLAYLVNDIRKQDTAPSLPYSFVTATTSWQGETLCADEMLLSDYAANRLGASVGDTMQMSYYITKGMKSLEERHHAFVVKAIIPLAQIQADSLMMAEFPGLSNVERCTDWDSDLPINMDRIEKIDEDFWYAYHQTPKAIVAYESVLSDWGTSFGTATGLEDANAACKLQTLTPHSVGITVVRPRQAAQFAATHGTDFSSLFLALGFFIILSAILLMQNPLVEMLQQRQSEIALYRSIGYTRRRIYTLFLRETMQVILLVSPTGLLGGMLYSGITLFLLGNVWSGATHTEGFSLHIQPLTLILSWIIGLLISLLTVCWAIHSCLKEQTSQPVVSRSAKGLWLWTAFLLVLTLVGFVCNLILWHSIVVFVVCGLLWIFTCALSLLAYIRYRNHIQQDQPFSHQAMLWTQFHAGRSNIMLSFWSLSMGVFTVFAVGLNRPSFNNLRDNPQLTGGFDLWCECSVPLQYDLNQAAVRRKLHLQDLPDSVCFMQIQKHTQDEASCLNLNKVSTPTVLGVSATDLRHFQLSEKLLNNGLLIDQESLIWSLMKTEGDTLQYQDGGGQLTSLRIDASYPTGIFHGNALMDKERFAQLWPEETGSHILLVRTGEGKEQEVKELLENVLSDYGVRITTTRQRIELFFTVTDTYLTIFLTLGGLGLLLGIFSLVIVIRKNLTLRRSEIQLMLTLGYSESEIRKLLLRENLPVPLYAVIVGSLGSVISISANVAGAGWITILTALIFLVAILYAVHYGIKSMINNLSISI